MGVQRTAARLAALAVLASSCGGRSELPIGELDEPSLVRACPDGWEDCDGDGVCDTETAASADDCGECGRPCADGLYCGRGQCVHGEAIVQLSLGAQHSCVLRARGEVLCWGWNEDGQLGIGTGEPVVTAPAPVLGLDDVVQISAGAFNVCARHRTGLISCWGDGPFVDYATAPTQRVPTPAPFVPDAAIVSSKGPSACILQLDGRVKCWGFNDLGCLGSGSLISSMVPVGVVDLGNAISISNATCAVRADRTVVCWGDNQWGRLGVGSPPRSTGPVVVPGLDAVAKLAVNSAYACALVRGGELWCWGYSPATTAVPEREDRVEGRALDVAAGGTHYCVTQDNATIWCQGGATVPAFTPDLDDPVTIAAGLDYNCALLSSGEVVCWGNNDHGQLGNGTQMVSFTPVPVVGL